MHRIRKGARRAARWAATVVLAVGVLAAAPQSARADFSIFDLKNPLIQFLLDQLGTPGAFELTAETVRTPPEGGTSLLKFAISDEEGPWLTASEIYFSFDAEALLGGLVDIPRIRVVDLQMTRLPSQPETPAAEAAAPPPGELVLEWPRSPISLIIRSFELDGARVSDRVLPQAIAFSGRGDVEDQGDAQSLRLSLSREDAVSGAINLEYLVRFEAGTLTLKLEADEEAGGLVAETFALPADAASRVTFTADGPPADWRVALDAETVGVYRAAGAGSVSYDGPLSADLNLTVTPGAQLDPDVARALSPSATVVARVREQTGGLVLIEQAELRARDVEASVSGSYRRSDGVMDFAMSALARAGLSDLIPNGALTEARFDGRLAGAPGDVTASGELALTGLRTPRADVGALRAQAELDFEDAQTRFALSGDANDVRLDRLGPEIIGAARLELDGVATTERISLASARLTAAPLDVRVSGDVDLTPAPGAAALALSAELRNLAPLARPYGVELEGALSLEGALRGSLAAPLLEAEARFASATFRPPGGRRLTAEDGRVSAKLALGERIEGPVNLSVRDSVFGPARVRGDVSLGTDRFEIADFEADAFGLTGGGDLRLDAETGVVGGEISARLDRADRLSPFIGVDLRGALEAQATLGPGAGASFSLSGRDVAAEGVSAARLAAQGALASLLDLRGLTLQLTADRVAAGGLAAPQISLSGRIDDLRALSGVDMSARVAGLQPLAAAPPLDLTLAASGSAQNLELSLAGEAFEERGGERAFALGVDAAGRLRRVSGGHDLSVARLILGAHEDRLRLAEPTTLRLRPSGLSVAPFELILPRGGVLGAEIGAGQGGRAAAVLRDLDLTLLADYAGAPIASGRADAEIDLDAGAGAGRLVAAVTGFRPVGGESVKPLRLDAQSDWAGGRLDTEFRASGALQTPLVGRISLPLVATSLVDFRAPPGGALDGALRWSGDLSEIWALTPPSDHLLAGATDLNIGLDGTLAAPMITGGLTVTGGRYDNLALGTIFTDLEATSQLDAQNRFTLNVVGRDGATGDITAMASLDLVGEPSIEATSELTKATVLRRDDAAAKVSGAVDIAGPLSAVAVSGELVVDAAEVDLGRVGGPTIVDLGEVVFVSDGEEEPSAQAGARGPGPLLDITLRAPGNMFVEGRGLESEWAMDLAIRGPAADPAINGEIRRIAGALSLLGAQFDFPRGVLTFDGDADPLLDIVFSREDNDVEGRIEIAGRASDPLFSFASTPSLPEDEVLPRVLFGRSKQALSPSETAQLAAGVATLLTGSSGGLGAVTAGLGVNAGLDGFNAGRNVGDGLYVGAAQNYDGSGGSAVVELEVFDDVTLDAEINPDEGSSVGASWKLDF